MATIYINKTNFFENLSKISSINPNILAVIKDNAYGHGIITISKLLKEFGIKKVCVRNNQEAEIIKGFFEEILVFNPTTARNGVNISYAINSITQLKKNRHPYIHLKFDTGMHRNGILIEEIKKALDIVKEKNFEIRGVFSHFCCSEEINNDTFIQYENFKKIKQIVEDFCKKNNLKKPYFHIANSTALDKLPDTFDYVRPGIAMYGGIEGYKPVMKLVGNVVSVREIENDGVGYNKRFFSKERIILSTIDVGYSDGIPYFRNGCKLKYTEAVGKISMDYMSVLGEFKKEVVIFDDIKEFVKNFDTITYDILVKMSPRIKRVVV